MGGYGCHLPVEPIDVEEAGLAGPPHRQPKGEEGESPLDRLARRCLRVGLDQAPDVRHVDGVGRVVHRLPGEHLPLEDYAHHLVLDALVPVGLGRLVALEAVEERLQQGSQRTFMTRAIEDRAAGFFGSRLRRTRASGPVVGALKRSLLRLMRADQTPIAVFAPSFWPEFLCRASMMYSWDR